MLIERDDPLHQLVSRAHELSTGRGGIMLVIGEAGIGKTSLLEEFKQQIPKEADLIWSGCDPLNTPRPFGPLYDITAGRSNSVLSMLEEGASPSIISSAFYTWLDSLSTPLVIVIEDIHWADNASIDLIKYLARRIAFVNCLLVLSLRDDELESHHALRNALAIMPAAHTSRLNLKPLSEEGVNLLANSANKPIQNLHKITSGNPFFVTELLATDGVNTQSIPASVQDAINTRLFKLIPQEREFLETLSVIPRAVSLSLIEKLVGPTGETFALACMARKLLVRNGNTEFRFRHELARLGTLSRVTVNEQKKIHSRVLRALEEIQPNVELGALVHHAAGAFDAQRVLKYAPTAAKNAASLGAHREAASYLAAALKFVEYADTQLAAQLYEDWAYEAGLALRIDHEVIEARKHAITLWRAVSRNDKIGENLRWLSRLHWYRGETVEAGHYANEAIRVLEDSPPSSEKAMAYSLRSQLDMLNDRMDDAIKWGEKALALEKEHPKPEVKVHALNNIGSALLLRGDEKGEPLLRESMQIAIKHDLHEHAARAFTNLSDYFVRYKKLDAAEEATAQGIEYDTRYDLESWTYYLVGIQAQLRLEQGRLRDAETISQGVLEMQQLTLLMHLPAISVLTKAQLRLGSADHKKTLSKVLDDSFATDEIQYIIPARLSAVESAWYNDNRSAAYEQLSELVELDESLLDHWRAGEITAWVQRFNFDLELKCSLPLATPYQLEVDQQHEAAAEAWLSLGIPYSAAICLLNAGQQKLPLLLPKAYKILDSIDAKGLLPTVRSQAKELGILNQLPGIRRGPYKASRQHPLGLTGKEQEILTHMLEGTSNKDIASALSRSQRTIENHVSSILGKLNVSNRLDAVLKIQNEPWLRPKQKA